MSKSAEKRSGVKWLALTLVSFLGVLAAGAAYLYLPALIPETSTNIVMISAEEGPFKKKPADPGGKIITNQDSKVMKMLGDFTPKTEEVETLLPPSDKPELPPVAVETATKPEAKMTSKGIVTSDDRSESNKSGTQQNSLTRLALSEVPTSKKDFTRDGDKSTGNPDDEISASDADEKDSAPVKDALANKRPAKTIIKAPKSVTPSKPASKSTTSSRVVTETNEPTYIVQLAAFRKEDIAAEQAGLLLKKHEKRLQGATLGTISIDKGENGIFWRIVSEPLSREAADTICAALKRAGQDCILRKFTSPSS